jgi:FSR family fosmidomycin resistance protein-like MFS transporter
MTQASGTIASPEQHKSLSTRFSDFRILFAGLLPLFMVAHFGHHVVGAMLSPLLPMIRDDLHLNYTEAGLIVSVFSIVGGAAQLPAGWLADRIGTRPMILISVSGVAVGGLLIGLSHTYGMLLVLLGITALATGGYHPSAAAAISSFTPEKLRGRALGLHLIGGTSSFWVTLLVVAPMAMAWTWRVPYIVLSIPVMVLGVILFFLMGRRNKADAREASLSRAKEPITETGPVKIRWRVFLPFLALTVGTAMIMQSVGAYYSLFAKDELGVSSSGVVLLMAISPFVGVFIAPLGGYLSDRFGAAPVVLGSALVAGPILFAMSKVGGVAVFAMLLVIIGVVNMARAPSAEAYFVTQIPPKRRATILGIYFFAGAELAGVMTPLAGRLLDSYGFGPVLVGAAIAQVALTVICSFALRSARTFTNSAAA